MPTPSGDTMPTTFTDPSLDWSADVATETASPAVESESTQSDSDQPPASATTSPETPATDSAAPLESGPIPFERHKQILEDERKLRSDLDAKWQRVAWAESLQDAGKTPQQIQEALNLYDGVDGNPVGVFERLYELLSDHPQYAPAIRSFAGRVLGGQRQTAAPQPTGAQPDPNDAEPQPDFEGPGGALFYSATQQAKWNAWSERRLEAKLNERLNPLVEERDRAQQQERERQAQAAELSRLTKELADFRTKPHFVEHEADIKAYLKSTQWKASIQDAYDYVMTVLRPLAQTTKANTMADLQKQAQASGIKPSTSAPVTQGSPKGFFDPGLKWE